MRGVSRFWTFPRHFFWLIELIFHGSIELKRVYCPKSIMILFVDLIPLMILKSVWSSFTHCAQMWFPSSHFDAKNDTQILFSLNLTFDMKGPILILLVLTLSCQTFGFWSLLQKGTFTLNNSLLFMKQERIAKSCKITWVLRKR